jgi:site-specific recombinase XerD
LLHRRETNVLNGGENRGDVNYGRPFSQAGFSKWFSERASMAGLPKNSSPHGLRKSAASNLAEAGATTAEIAAFTGHKSARELEVYTKAASQKALADHALTKLIRTQNEREVSNS